MRLPNQRYLARLKRTDRRLNPAARRRPLASTDFFSPDAPRAVRDFRIYFAAHRRRRVRPWRKSRPQAAHADPSSGGRRNAGAHNSKKVARQARAASENAAVASREAANASAAAALASKQAASVANRIEGSGPSNADVSLENNPGADPEGAPVSVASNRANAASSPALAADPGGASVTPSTPTLSSPGFGHAGPRRENPILREQRDLFRTSMRWTSRSIAKIVGRRF